MFVCEVANMLRATIVMDHRSPLPGTGVPVDSSKSRGSSESIDVLRVRCAVDYPQICPSIVELVAVSMVGKQAVTRPQAKDQPTQRRVRGSSVLPLKAPITARDKLDIGCVDERHGYHFAVTKQWYQRHSRKPWVRARRRRSAARVSTEIRHRLTCNMPKIGSRLGRDPSGLAASATTKSVHVSTVCDGPDTSLVHDYLRVTR
jgi:hypothetical protein